MKKYLITLTCVLFAIAMYCSSLAYGNIPSTGETDNGTGAGRVQCKCSGPENSSSKCKSSHEGNLCAQSKPGENIQCNSFNSNC